MLCVLILYISGGTYSLKSTPNDRFFEKLFMAILFTLRNFARNLLRGNRRRNIFGILFLCLARGSNPGFSSNKRTHYLQDHGDVTHEIWKSRLFLDHTSYVCIYVRLIGSLKNIPIIPITKQLFYFWLLHSCPRLLFKACRTKRNFHVRIKSFKKVVCVAI